MAMLFARAGIAGKSASNGKYVKGAPEVYPEYSVVHDVKANKSGGRRARDLPFTSSVEMHGGNTPGSLSATKITQMLGVTQDTIVKGQQHFMAAVAGVTPIRIDETDASVKLKYEVGTPFRLDPSDADEPALGYCLDKARYDHCASHWVVDVHLCHVYENDTLKQALYKAASSPPPTPPVPAPAPDLGTIEEFKSALEEQSKDYVANAQHIFDDYSSRGLLNEAIDTLKRMLLEVKTDPATSVRRILHVTGIQAHLDDFGKEVLTMDSVRDAYKGVLGDIKTNLYKQVDELITTAISKDTFKAELEKIIKLKEAGAAAPTKPSVAFPAPLAGNIPPKEPAAAAGAFQVPDEDDDESLDVPPPPAEFGSEPSRESLARQTLGTMGRKDLLEWVDRSKRFMTAPLQWMEHNNLMPQLQEPAHNIYLWQAEHEGEEITIPVYKKVLLKANWDGALLHYGVEKRAEKTKELEEVNTLSSKIATCAEDFDEVFEPLKLNDNWDPDPAENAIIIKALDSLLQKDSVKSYFLYCDSDAPVKAKMSKKAARSSSGKRQRRTVRSTKTVDAAATDITSKGK